MSKITKVAVIGTGVIGIGWIIRLLAHDIKVFAFDKKLNQKNNLINDSLSEKIEILQKMFQDIITPDLMKALEELQKSLNEDDFQKALEELNNFEFEMEDLENQLDRMIDLFEQVVTEQKLDELIKKIENMNKLQEEISNKISNNNLNSNTQLMEEEQRNNLNDLFQTMENTETLLEKNSKKTADSLNELRNSATSKNLENKINEILNNNNSKKNISNEIEKILT